MASISLVSSCCSWFSSGWLSLFTEHHVGPGGTRIPSIIIKYGENSYYIENSIPDYWKLTANLIVNDIDKPYIVVVFASWHLMETGSDSILRYVLILPILFWPWLVCSLIFTWHLLKKWIITMFRKRLKENYVNKNYSISQKVVNGQNSDMRKTPVQNLGMIISG